MAREFKPGPGRPKGRTCGHVNTDGNGGSCKKSARVIVIIQMITQGKARRYKVYRCFEHYLDLEESSRGSSVMSVHRAEAL